MNAPAHIDNLRLPRWLLPADWPLHEGVPVLARIEIEAGRVHSVRPMHAADLPSSSGWDAAGRLALPGFVDAHTHLDKTFTLPRMKEVRPGLLGAIDAMLADRVHWSPAGYARMRRVDHSTIFLFIAGCYTPIALLGVTISIKPVRTPDFCPADFRGPRNSPSKPGSGGTRRPK